MLLDDIKQKFDKLRVEGNLKQFKKIAKVLFRQAEKDEFIITICSGTIETTRRCQGGEIIIQSIQVGTSAECYVMELNKFQNRYLPLKMPCYYNGKWYDVAEPKGIIEAFKWTGDSFEFVAPWGEKMICESGDFLAHTIDGDNRDFYRIALKEFVATYEKL